MLRSTKLLICRFRSNSADGRVILAQAGISSLNPRRCAVEGLDSSPSACSGEGFRRTSLQSVDSGYALLFAMIAAAVVLIGLAAVLPSAYEQAQREREQELIFRGIQYGRAVAMFHQKFQRFPTSIEELIKPTNGFRFLRKEYPDPMTRSGKWRFIHANAMGVLLDSKSQPQGTGGPGQPNAGQGAGGFGMSGPSSLGGSAFGQQGTGPGTGQSTGGFSLDSNSGGNPPGGQQGSAFFGQGTPAGGSFIVGVASTSHKQSLRIWNKKTHYDEWEFIGVDLGALGIVTSLPGLPQGGGVGGVPSQGGAPGTFGGSPQGNPATQGQNQGMFSP